MSITENTVNDLLADLLRSKGVDITTQTSARTLDGKRQPDFELHRDGLVYYGEGEWLHSYHIGLVQAIDYGDIPGASGYFLLGYPDAHKETITQRRLTSSDPATLLRGLNLERCLFKVALKRTDIRRLQVEELPDWVNSVVSPAPLPPQTEEFKDLMRSVVARLTDYLPHGKGSPRLFEHIVATIPQKKDEEDAARSASAYLLLDQLVFHRILASHKELGFAEIDYSQIKSATDVKARFTEVTDKDYRAIFETNVIDLFPRNALPFIRSLIKLISHLRPEEFTRDLLGSIFHELIPKGVRRPVAAYYTNQWAARLLASLAGVGGADRVADFACGSGTLLVAAYEKKSATDSRPDNQSRHSAYLAKELTGVDVMPFAAHLAVVQLALLNPVLWTDRVQIAVEDSTSLRPGDPIRSLERRARSPQKHLSAYAEGAEPEPTVTRGAVSPDGAGIEFSLTPQDVVIMNPPFTRKRLIKKEYRGDLTDSFPDYAEYINREMGFSAYFVPLADRFLSSGGRLALVFPAALMRQSSLSGIRKLLRERYQIQYIVLSTYRTAFSEASQIRDLLLVAEKTAVRNRDCTIATIRVPLSAENLDWITGRISGGQGSPEVEVSRVPQSAFEVEDWLPIIPGMTLEGSGLPLPKGAPVSPLIELPGAALIRGVRIEASSAHVNTADTIISSARNLTGRQAGPAPPWVVTGRESGNLIAVNDAGTTIRVPIGATIGSARTISGQSKMLVAEPFDYVVTQRFAGDAAFWVTKNPQGILRRRREHVRRRTARLGLAGSGNVDLAGPGTSLLAIVGEPRFAPTWNLWALDLPTLIDAKIVAAYWNSSFGLSYLLSNWTEVRGSYGAWRKPVIERAPVLDQRKMTSQARTRIVALFDHLAGESLPSLSDQYRNADTRRLELDFTVGEALGYNEIELKPLLADFYLEVTERFDRMTTMMKGDTKNKGRSSGE